MTIEYIIKNGKKYGATACPVCKGKRTFLFPIDGGLGFCSNTKCGYIEMFKKKKIDMSCEWHPSHTVDLKNIIENHGSDIDNIDHNKKGD